MKVSFFHGYSYRLKGYRIHGWGQSDDGLRCDDGWSHKKTREPCPLVFRSAFALSMFIVRQQPGGYS